MKKISLLFLFIPLFMAFQCETGEPCNINNITKEKQGLITVENLQVSYNVGDIIWLNSNLERIQNFDNTSETTDLFSYTLDYSFGIQFYKSSVYNSSIYLCLDENTTEITNGSLGSFCNLFVYEKVDDFLNCRVGIKLLETGNYKIELSRIQTFRENGLNCEDTSINIDTSFSNNNEQYFNFTVE
jgi:hypothetical protein